MIEGSTRSSARSWPLSELLVVVLLVVGGGGGGGGGGGAVQEFGVGGADGAGAGRDRPPPPRLHRRVETVPYLLLPALARALGRAVRPATAASSWLDRLLQRAGSSGVVVQVCVFRVVA